MKATQKFSKRSCSVHERPSFFRVLRNEGCSPINGVVNRHISGTMKGAPNVRKERVGLVLLHFILYLNNDGSRIPLNENLIYPQLLPDTDDACLGSSKLYF